jgi:penicillin-binding protein 1A
MPRRRRSKSDDLLPLLLAARRRRDRGDDGGNRTLRVALVVAVLAVAALAAAVVTAAGVVRVALTDCTLAGRRAKVLPQTSFIYAKSGRPLGAIRAPTYRQPVSYGAISPWVRRATIAAEDRTFWTNDGLNYTSIARAVLADAAAGRPVQGASTITQQLVRNLYLSDAKTLSRKRLEACLSLKLARRWSKRRVLAAYLNRVSYGHRALGIEAAARTYFGLPASRLGPDQAALLAGLPQAPTTYDPLVDPKAALTRRNYVLHAMLETGALSPARYRRLLGRPLGLHPGRLYRRRRDPEFFSYIQAQLVDAYGAARVRTGGLRVYTTVDPRAQAIALGQIRRTLDLHGDPAAAVAAIDPHTGAIRTIASAWHGHKLDYDLAAQGQGRQTGSAFKTFVLTDAVWRHHADPNTTWYDSSPFTYQPTPQSKPWTPHTYENRYFGPETLTKATILSDNVVYAKLTLDVGPRSVARVAHLMGIHSPLEAVPSIGLGSNSVRPLMLASAYATLASGGVYHHPYAIRKVVLPNGKVDHSHRWGERKGARILPAGVAWTVTQVLEDNVRSGTGIAAQIPGRHVAGKTGTTTNWTDAWFAGYTPRLTAVTWVGYPRRARSMADVHGIQVQGASFPAQIWHGYVSRVLGGSKPLSFRHAGWRVSAYRGPRSMSAAPTPTPTPTPAAPPTLPKPHGQGKSH